MTGEVEKYNKINSVLAYYEMFRNEELGRALLDCGRYRDETLLGQQYGTNLPSLPNLSRELIEEEINQLKKEQVGGISLSKLEVCL